MTTRLTLLVITGATALGAQRATAQPVPIPITLPPPTDPAPPDGTPPPTPDGATPDGATPDGAAPDGATPDGAPPDGATPDDTTPDGGTPPPPPIETPVVAVVPTSPPDEDVDEAPPIPPLTMPELLLAPSGSMLPAGVIYSRSGVDTSGGLSGDLRFGLGDVAEFGVAITDLVRSREDSTATPKRLAPFYTATFRMGLAENRLFRHQPALALGFRKSFEYEAEGRRARIAELHLAASKHLGPRASVHLNASFWDASVETNDEGAVVLHDQGLRRQARLGGGVAVRAVEDADILVDLAWVPEFCFTCTEVNRTRLRPILSWGVRYDLASWAQLQSGVRVPDIGDANLLDAQIFGQLTIINRSLERVVARRRAK